MIVENFATTLATMQANPKAQLIEHLIGVPLSEWVRQHREDGQSWQWIANQVLLTTSGNVTVSAEYLRQLFAEAAA